VIDRHYAGGWWDWLTPFSVLCGVSLLIAYAMLGACWLHMKTEGALQEQTRRYAAWLGAGTVICIALVSLVTPFLDQAYYRHWLTWPSIVLTAPVPLAVAALSYAFYVSLKKGRERAPFVIALGLFVLCFMGLGISIYPDIVPGALTIEAAAAPESSQ